MARIFATGFEPGHVGILDIDTSGAIETSTAGSWSTYAYRGNTNTTSGRLSFAAASELYVGFRYDNTNLGTNDRILGFQSPTPTDQVTLMITAGGALEIRRGSRTGTVIATGTTVLSQSTWYYIECHILISDTVGVFEVLIDGVQELNLTSADTRNDAGSSDVSRLFFGPNICHYDDLYVNDTTGSVNTGYAGDTRLTAYIPNADGSNSGMTLSTGTSHFAVVDERPPNTTDYAFGTGTTEVDTLNVPNMPAAASVQSVTLWLYALKSDANPANIAHVLKSGATTDVGSDLALTTSYAYYRKVYDQDPNGPTDWTASAIDAMEIGAKSR